MTTLTIDPQDPEQFKRFQVIMLKPHLRLLAMGMKNSQFTGQQILDKVSALTGKPYKRGQYKQALKDLEDVK